MAHRLLPAALLYVHTGHGHGKGAVPDDGCAECTEDDRPITAAAANGDADTTAPLSRDMRAAAAAGASSASPPIMNGSGSVMGNAPAVTSRGE
jgi:hypothetical protein